MPGFRIFYASKTNSHKRILEIMQALGSNFEISSKAEMDMLLDIDVRPDQIISSNPIKSSSFIKAAHAAGVKDFAFDSRDEIKKLSEFAPGSRVYVRLSVSNEGSQWPLSGKFGAETEESAKLLVEASKNNLTAYGITFHVGSQCTDEISWANAIEKSKLVWDIVQKHGINLRMLNIGGGFPVRYIDSVPQIDKISSVIERKLKEDFPENIDLFVEPGRAFAGEAGILVCSVIATARRDGKNWLYLDAGVFNGLMESVGGIEYSMVTEKKGPLKKWIVAGPSCDGFDVISRGTQLPEMEVGDKVYVLSAGAYTTAYASEFNGFPIPETYFF